MRLTFMITGTLLAACGTIQIPIQKVQIAQNIVDSGTSTQNPNNSGSSERAEREVLLPSKFDAGHREASPGTSPGVMAISHSFSQATAIPNGSMIEFAFDPGKEGQFSIQAFGQFANVRPEHSGGHVVLMVCDLIDATQKCKEVDIVKLGTHVYPPHRTLEIKRPVRVVIANPYSFDIPISNVRVDIRRVG